MPQLYYGCVGEDVRHVQKDLNLYYYCPPFQKALKEAFQHYGLNLKDMAPLVPDAQYGPLTRAAVWALQVQKCLTMIDGIVGKETLNALYPLRIVVARCQIKKQTVSSQPSPPQPAAPSQPSPPQPATPSQPSHPQQATIAPAKIQKVPVEQRHFPGYTSPVPVPKLPPSTPPSIPAGPKKEKKKIQLRPGATENFVSGSSPYTTLNLDIIAPLLVKPNYIEGLDVGGAVPLCSKCGTKTATIWWTVSGWPNLFEWKDWFSLTAAAKIGLGVRSSKGGPLDPDLNLSAGFIAGLKISDHLKLELRGSESGTFYLDDNQIRNSWSTTVEGDVVLTLPLP